MDLSGILINNRFKIDKEIVQGRISTIYLAFDLNDKNSPRVVKFLKNSSISTGTENIIRFRSELKKVCSLSHANIVKTYDFGEMVGLHYIVSDFIQGKSLYETLQDSDIPIDRCVDIIQQVSRGLQYLHENGILHRDIKPGNILLNDIEIKITDLGIAHIKEFEKTIIQGNIKDILGYMSPEQYGVTKKNVDERSDLYSLGVIFYQMLTGVLPFEGEDISSIVHQQIAKIPEDPTSLNPELPGILEKIVMRLLEKEPENRYQSAQGLISDLERYINGERDFELGLKDRWAKLSYRTRLVGREEEFSRLVSLYEYIKEDRGCGCYITGKAGIGKTRLVEDFSEYVFSQGGAVVKVNCSVQGNMTPFGPVRDILGSYVKLFKSYTSNRRNEIVRKLKDEFSDIGEMLIKLNPALKEILGDCPPLVQLEPERESKRFHFFLSLFFHRLSDLENGLVIIIDDINRADEGTFNLLNEMLNTISVHRMAIIFTCREDEIQDKASIEKFVHRFKDKAGLFERIHLKSFTLEQMNTFISGILFESMDNVLRISGFVLERSKGNPFFAIEILKQLVEENVLIYENERWRLDKDGLENINIPGSILDIIIKRAEAIDGFDRDVLSYSAVFGNEFNINLLIKLYKEMNNRAEDLKGAGNGFSEIELIGVIDRAVELNLLESDPREKDKIRFVHDRIREAFYNRIEEDERRLLHLSAASVIEKENPENLENVIFDLSNHFVKGGDISRSIAFAYPAGVNAMENYANEEAVKYFSLALELMQQEGTKDTKPEVKIKEKLAYVYLTSGNFDEAIRLYNEILTYMETKTEKAKIYKNITNAYFKKGDWANCERFGRIGLGLLGRKLPGKKLPVFSGLVKDLLIHILHSMLPKIFIRRRENTRSEKYKLIISFYRALNGLFLLSDTLKFLKSVLGMLNLAESKIGKSRELGACTAGYGTLCMVIPLFKRSIKYHRRALGIRKEFDDAWGIAQSIQNIGFCYMWMGQYRKSLEYFQDSANRFKKIGDINEFGMSVHGIVENYYLLSDYERAKIANEQYSVMSIQTGNIFSMGFSWILNAIIYTQCGDFEQAEQYALKAYELTRENKLWMTFCVSCIMLGALYYEKNELDKSMEYMQEAWDLYRKQRFLKHYTSYLFPAMAGVYIADYTMNIEKRKARRKFYLRRIKSFCKKALRKTRLWASHYGISLWVNAQYYALKGHNKKAEKMFLQSIEHNRRIGARYWQARAYYDYGLFLLKIENTKKAKDNLEAAYDIFCSIGSRHFIDRLKDLLGVKDREDETTSIERMIDKDRFTSITRLTRELSQLSNVEDLLNEILLKAIEITGAQHGNLFLLNEERELEEKAAIPIMDHQLSDFSLGIVMDVYKNDREVLLEDAQKEDVIIKNESSIYPMNTKSVLCVPVKEQEKTIGVCYLENSLSSGVFREMEVNILQIFLSQVAPVIGMKFLGQSLKTSKVEEKSLSSLSSISMEKMKTVIEYINENYSSVLSREGLASLVDIHPDNLGKYFKLYSGKKINDYINELRIADAKKKLKETDSTIIDIAFSVGFESLRTFNKVFHDVTKITPTQYRKQF